MSVIGRNAQTLVIDRIDCRIDLVIAVIALVIGWQIEVTARRIAAINGTTGTVDIMAITITGITVTGTAIGDRDPVGTTGGTAIPC